jgi:hypothetical protein
MVDLTGVTSGDRKTTGLKTGRRRTGRYGDRTGSRAAERRRRKDGRVGRRGRERRRLGVR